MIGIFYQSDTHNLRGIIYVYFDVNVWSQILYLFAVLQSKADMMKKITFVDPNSTVHMTCFRAAVCIYHKSIDVI